MSGGTADTYGGFLVGGTSESAPIFNGLEADTENFVAAQTYGWSNPQCGV